MFVRSKAGAHLRRPAGPQPLFHPRAPVGVYQGAVTVLAQCSFVALYAVLKGFQFTVAGRTPECFAGFEFLPQGSAVRCELFHILLLEADAGHINYPTPGWRWKGLIVCLKWGVTVMPAGGTLIRMRENHAVRVIWVFNTPWFLTHRRIYTINLMQTGSGTIILSHSGKK